MSYPAPYPYGEPGRQPGGNYAPQYNPDPQPPSRPQAVTIAGMALVLGALSTGGLFLVNAVGVLQTSVAQTEQSDRITAVIFGSMGVGFGLVLVFLGIGVLRASQVARVLCFVLCGFALLCAIGSTAALSILAVNDGVADSSQVTLTLLAAVSLVIYATVLLCLTLPVSAHWFRAMKQLRQARQSP